MNSLSWLMYTADVVAGIGGALALIVILGIGAVALRVIWSMVTYSNYEDDQSLTAGKSTVVKALTVVLIALLIDVLVPSKETVYLIAASEVGEQVVTSEEGKRVLGKIETWLDNKLGETPTQQEVPPSE